MLRKMASTVAAAAALAMIPASGAFAAAFHPNPAGHTIDVGPSPTGVPANCPFTNEDASLLVVDGHAVSHDTSNKNGDWGGLTLTGTAIFQEAPYSGFDTMGNPIDTGAPVPFYEGHLSYWEGGGNNAAAQTEGGFTLDFHGSGPAGSFDLHVNTHQTTNNSGTPTASVANVSVTCS